MKNLPYGRIITNKGLPDSKGSENFCFVFFLLQIINRIESVSYKSRGEPNNAHWLSIVPLNGWRKTAQCVENNENTFMVFAMDVLWQMHAVGLFMVHHLLISFSIFIHVSRSYSLQSLLRFLFMFIFLS